MGYNDNHVDFENAPDPDGVTFSFTGLSPENRTKNDNVFENEDDATRQQEDRQNLSGNSDNSNAYLRSYDDITSSGSNGVTLEVFFD